MEKLYRLTRQQLMDISIKFNGGDKELWDPYTDQQLRDLIVNRAIQVLLADLGY